MLTLVGQREERIPDGYVGLVRNLFGPTFKQQYQEQDCPHEAFKELQKKTWQIPIEELIGMFKEYYQKRQSTTNRHLKEKLTPTILNFKDLKNVDKLKVAKAQSIDDILDTIINIDTTNKIEVEIFAEYCGLRKTKFSKRTKTRIQEKLGLNTNPTNYEKVKAALYHSNVLQQYLNPTTLDNISLIEKRNQPHNNLAQTSAITGIKATTIKYWTAKLEDREDIQKFRKENFGKRYSDLTKQEVTKIYLTRQKEKLTYEQTKEQFNLSSEHTVRRIIQYGKKHLTQTLPAKVYN